MKTMAVLVALVLCACSDDGSATDLRPAVLDGAGSDGRSSEGSPADSQVDRISIHPEAGSADIGPVPDGVGGLSCYVAQQRVYKEMARINHCTTASDCAFTYGSCPFGCHIPYNKGESTASLSQLIAAFKGMTQCPQCVYKCAPPGTLSCANKLCVMSYP